MWDAGTGGIRDTTKKLKAYGVTAKEKLPEFPSAASFPAVFGPKLDVVYWQAMFAPAGTPEPVIKTLNEALQTAVSDPANLKTWAAQDVSVFRPISVRLRRPARS